ncbi:MAG: hypothetical protein IJH20_05600 [Bacilli bacterium]|nr:hypothetical protein [Bacilli bacterium]
MEEFDTLEKVIELFKKSKYYYDENNIFIVYKDMQKSSGLKSGMEYPYEGLIINETNKGLAMIPLKQGGIVLTQSINKMEIDKERDIIFIPNEDITSITIKNFALLNSKTKRISIKTNDGKNYLLFGKINEKSIPYQQENFTKFIEHNQ